MTDHLLRKLMPRDRWQRLRMVLCLDVLATVLFFACVAPTPPEGWEASRGPVVPHDTFPADCSLCHTTGGWNEMRDDFRFDHGAETGVVLVGAHEQAECLRCHNDRGPVAKFAARGCAGCHEDQHQGALGANCEECHAQTDWRPQGVTAEHARTRFPLVGVHAATACQECHPGSEAGVFQPTPTRCEDCHQAELAAATSPNHVALGWVADCQVCHKPTVWPGEGFVHGAWPLTGAHASANCDACHTGGTFLGTPRDCFACHAADYQGASDPNHVANNFPTNCQVCHSTSSWEGAIFSHAGITSGCADCHLPEYLGTNDPNHVASGFPTSCELCHQPGSWDSEGFNHAGVTSGCADCHLPEYQGASDPNHVASGFPTTCELCHQTGSWDIENFSHPGITGNCVDCHLPEYQATSDPNHTAIGLPTNCAACHQVTSWSITSFSHPGITGNCSACHLPEYLGTSDPNHAAIGLPTTCENCHQTGTWTVTSFSHVGITGNCAACHLPEYQATSDPNHLAIGLPPTCEACHQTTSWTINNFTHPGATGTGNCASCHLQEYLGVTQPNHVGLGFPTTCEVCHLSTNNWEQVQFNHVFQIGPGARHAGISCNTCHPGGPPATPNCLQCHGQIETAGHHSGVGGYVWSNPACMSCHPTGEQR